MSTAAISEVSLRLKQVLQAALDQMTETPPKVDLFDPGPPPQGIEATNRVSLWLYQATVDEFSRNVLVPESETTDRRQKVRFRVAPLGVNLGYLITPILPSPEREQEALARIMLAMHEQSSLSVPYEEADASKYTAKVRVSLNADSLDDRVKLWEALTKPYRLSLTYQVRTVHLASKEVEVAAAVASTTTALEDKQPSLR